MPNRRLKGIMPEDNPAADTLELRRGARNGEHASRPQDVAHHQQEERKWLL
jgi:hypothetical protein